MSADTVQTAIETALNDGPGYTEQLLAEGIAVVVLEGDLIVKMSPDGTRQVLKKIDHT